MDLKDKLLKLVGTDARSRSDISLAAGLYENAISDLINKTSKPSAEKALQVARALNVPLDWLADDSQGWPPPKGDLFLSVRSLIAEQATREEFDKLVANYEGADVVLAAAFEVFYRADAGDLAFGVNYDESENIEFEVSDQMTSEARDELFTAFKRKVAASKTLPDVALVLDRADDAVQPIPIKPKSKRGKGRGKRNSAG